MVKDSMQSSCVGAMSIGYEDQKHGDRNEECHQNFFSEINHLTPTCDLLPRHVHETDVLPLKGRGEDCEGFSGWA